MELKIEKKYPILNCGRIVGLTRTRSDVTVAERRGMYGDLRVSLSLQSGEEESQCEWCVVSIFAPLSLSLSPPLSLSLSPPSLSPSWSSGPRTIVCFLLIWPHCREICLLYRFSLLIGSDWVFFIFYRGKLLLIIFIFRQISLTFRYALILCAEPPFFDFEESLSTDDISRGR